MQKSQKLKQKFLRDAKQVKNWSKNFWEMRKRQKLRQNFMRSKKIKNKDDKRQNKDATNKTLKRCKHNVCKEIRMTKKDQKLTKFPNFFSIWERERIFITFKYIIKKEK